MEKIIIKKYPNRRLYNTEEKEYLNLQDIAKLIRTGKKVQVIENQTQKDITQEILFQVIVADMKEGENIFPAETLHKIIEAKDTYLKEFLEIYFSSILDSFIQFKKNLQNNFNLWWQMPTNFMFFNDKKKQEKK